MYRLFRVAVLLYVLLALTWQTRAGGSGLNVVIVVNQDSTNSLQLGNYYAERRQVPPQNYLRISWRGSPAVWDYDDFNTRLLAPLLTMLHSRRLTNQVDYVVLSMDIPYRVIRAGPLAVAGDNSTTAALYYGFKSDYAEPSYNPASCNLPVASSNSYAGSEGIFSASTPDTASTNSFLAMMITSSNLSLAKTVIDRAVASDGTFSPEPVILSKSTDSARNVRFYSFDNAIFNTRLHGGYSMFRTNSDSPNLFTNLLGYESGHHQFSIQPGTFVPGAMADSLTSYGGLIFEANDHTTLLAFLDVGAAGSYGTIVEPCNYLEKFPSPQTYFYQARGFSLAECYYQSITNPYQGLLVGEPLASPFAQPASGFWSNLPPNALISGTTNLRFHAVAADVGRPVQQVDLFVDGLYSQTLTNIAPQPGNVLTLNIRGHAITYTVPSGATIRSVIEGLAGELNLPSVTNVTKVVAFPHGDRIELQSLDPFQAGAEIPLSVSSSLGAGGALTTFITASASAFLDTIATGIRSYELSGTPAVGSYLQLSVSKTNGLQVDLVSTNTFGALTLFQMVQQLAISVNSHPALATLDGLSAQDLFDLSPWSAVPTVQLNLTPNTSGWAAARIQVALSASTNLTITSPNILALEQNLPDLRPRAHLYVKAGVTNLPLEIPFASAAQPDGYHRLTAVIYEGTHVRTQRRVPQDVFIRNQTLAATFTAVPGDSNAVLETTLQFSVVANTNNIATIDLYGTGGLLGSVAGQASADFSVPANFLGAGLHPFYAEVISASGNRYRTETKWTRVVGESFRVWITAFPLTLSWPALAGHSYNILSTTNLTTPFQMDATVTPSNNIGQWTDTNPSAPSRFYRVMGL